MTIENTPQFKNSIVNKRLYKLLYYGAAMLLPNIFLFNLYTVNRELVPIRLSHVLTLGVILALISALAMFLTRFLVRNYEGSLLILLFSWSTFWLFETIYSLGFVNSKGGLLAILLIATLSLSILLRFTGIKLPKIAVIFHLLAGVICLLFFFNLVASIFANLSGSPVVETEQGDFYLRKEFYVDEALPSPNIYWIHMDGMINMTDMAYFFNEPQDELRSQLLMRGFVLNESAAFNTHDTLFSVPALLSPTFYDSYLGNLLAHGSGMLRRERNRLLLENFERDGISFSEDVAPYHELFNAFLQAGYRQIMISSFDGNVYVPLDYFYRLGYGNVVDGAPLTREHVLETEPHFLEDALDLIELLTLTTPLPYRVVLRIREGRFEWESIPSHADEINRLTDDPLNLEHERQLYRYLIDSFSVDTPRLTFMTLMYTHGNRWHWQRSNSAQHGDDSHRVDLYPLAYQYASEVMINMIDFILAQDPDAVIVLQADHGFHLHAAQRQFLSDGLTEAEVIQLQHSVFSAVRIPETYGGLDAPLHPLDITRELVNRFVGENYQRFFE